MEHKERDETIRIKMLDEIADIESFIANRPAEDMLSDRMCQKAVVMSLINIGELSKSFSESYSKRQIYLPFTIAASGGCERARKEFCRFAARARRGVNDQNEIHFDVYDICSPCPKFHGRPFEASATSRRINMVSSILKMYTRPSLKIFPY